jgi:hypothetical protein
MAQTAWLSTIIDSSRGVVHRRTAPANASATRADTVPNTMTGIADACRDPPELRQRQKDPDRIRRAC